ASLAAGCRRGRGRATDLPVHHHTRPPLRHRPGRADHRGSWFLRPRIQVRPGARRPAGGPGRGARGCPRPVLAGVRPGPVRGGLLPKPRSWSTRRMTVTDPFASSERLAHVVPLPDPAVPLPAHATVVVIGGGVMGVSTAWHLAEAGVTDIVVIERDTLGAGSSAKPLGGVRATFSDANNVLLGHRSLAAFETFPARFGAPIGLQQVGYLFLCRTEAELAAVQDSVRLQNSLGCNSRMITPAEAAQINPFLDPTVLLGASFSPRDGYAEPALVVAGYAAAATALGVRFCEHTEVFDAATRGDGSHHISTRRGDIVAD